MAQNGIFEMLNSPVAQGLLAGGLGAMASRGSTMQALGRGGLLGLSAMGQAQASQENRVMQQAKMQLEQQKAQREQQAFEQQQNMLGSIFGNGRGGSVGAGGSQQAVPGGLGDATVDQIAALKALGGQDLTDLWKLSQTGVSMDPGKYYQRNGQLQHMPTMDNGMTFNPQTGQAMAVPGYIGAQAALKGAEAQAQEAAKYPYTVGADREKQQTQASLDMMQVTGPDGNVYYLPRAQVVGQAGGGVGGGQGGQPFMANRNPSTVQAEQELNKNWVSGTFQPTIDAANAARGTLASIQAVRGLDLQTGWGTEAMAKGANFLVGLGIGGEEAQKLASNAQAFQSVSMDRLLKTLQAQAGPQTEGDAQRAAQTWVSLQNTPQANEFILDFAQAQAEMQARKAEFYQKALPIARRTGDLTEIDRRWQQVQGSIMAHPLMRKWQPKEGQ